MQKSIHVDCPTYLELGLKNGEVYTINGKDLNRDGVKHVIDYLCQEVNVKADDVLFQDCRHEADGRRSNPEAVRWHGQRRLTPIFIPICKKSFSFFKKQVSSRWQLLFTLSYSHRLIHIVSFTLHYSHRHIHAALFASSHSRCIIRIVTFTSSYSHCPYLFPHSLSLMSRFSSRFSPNRRLPPQLQVGRPARRYRPAPTGSADTEKGPTRAARIPWPSGPPARCRCRRDRS